MQASQGARSTSVAGGAGAGAAWEDPPGASSDAPSASGGAVGGQHMDVEGGQASDSPSDPAVAVQAVWASSQGKLGGPSFEPAGEDTAR